MRASTTVLCVMALLAATTASASAAPWFCHDIDCPPFTQTNITKYVCVLLFLPFFSLSFFLLFFFKFSLTSVLCVVCSRNGVSIETRQYSALYWVSTEVQGLNLDVATQTGFERLFNYISGSNVNQTKVSISSLLLQT
jgi:hypothetical protein